MVTKEKFLLRSTCKVTKYPVDIVPECSKMCMLQLEFLCLDSRRFIFIGAKLLLFAKETRVSPSVL